MIDFQQVRNKEPILLFHSNNHVMAMTPAVFPERELAMERSRKAVATA